MSDRKGKVKSDKERKKSEIESEFEIDGKKKKKKMKEKDYCDGEKTSERDKLVDETVMKKKTKKNKEIRDDSEAEDVKKKTKKNKEIRDDSEAEDIRKKTKKSKEIRAYSEGEDVGKKTKKNKDIRADSEVEDDAKRKKKKKKKRDSVGDEIGSNESSKIDALSKKRKRKRDDTDTRAEENTANFIKVMKEQKSKKKRRIDDSEAEEVSKESTKDTKKESKKKKKKKKKKQNEESETEEGNKELSKDSKKKKKKKQSEVSEIEEGNKDSTKDAKKKRKKKSIENSEAEQNIMNFMEDGKKKRKKKQKSSKSDANVTTPSSKSVKRVKFSDQVEVFPTEDEEIEDEEMEEEEEAGGVEVVRGKRFTKEEDELIKQSVLEYIENNNLGDEGLNMVMKCRLHPEIKGCWKQITSALPWRPGDSVYYRAHILFEGGSSKGVWTEEELELVKTFKEKHGPDWKTLAESLGKHRWHVKDAWRRIRLTMNKGKWSREEYQTLFDLVNTDLRLKAYQEKHSKHGMLRDNIPWMAISDKFGSRNHAICCQKWYDQLTSPMVAKGTWANVDDYRLLDELMKLDATCSDDVDWDNLVENRDGEICRKRWNQMVLHIGVPGTKTFAEQVEILSNRYCPDLAEDRENFDNRPYDPETPSRKKK